MEKTHLPSTGDFRIKTISPAVSFWLDTLTEKSWFLRGSACPTEASAFLKYFLRYFTSVDLIPESSNIQRNQQHQCVSEVLSSDTTEVRGNFCSWRNISLCYSPAMNQLFSFPPWVFQRPGMKEQAILLFLNYYLYIQNELQKNNFKERTPCTIKLK